MEKRKPSREELIGKLPTTGWDLDTGTPGLSSKDRTLEDIVRDTHARHVQGERAGIIKHLETEFELDMIQLQELWMHLGLPV